jgi:two-component system NtrC family sensor kinase
MMSVNEKLLEWYRFFLFGRLIVGVNHELDNYLSVVLGYAELLSSFSSDEDKVVEIGGKIMGSAEKISDMFKNYSTYVRPHKNDDNLFKVKETINDLISFAGFELRRKGVVLDLEYHCEDTNLMGDRRNFAFMLLNIMLNASEAAMETGGKQVVSFRKESSCTIISIADTGKGIPQNYQEKIFQPWFSTKPENFRMGLGLPISRYIAHQFRGEIRFKSDPGQGTEFQIIVPGG